MTQPRRMPVSAGYTQDFDLLGPATSSMNVSLKLEATLASDGGGQGGRDLANLLSDLGEAYVEEGRVTWEPPAGLDQVFVDYFSRSVDELNRRLQAGTLTIDESGNIRPPTGSERAGRPAQPARRWQR